MPNNTSKEKKANTQSLRSRTYWSWTGDFDGAIALRDKLSKEKRVVQ